VAGLGEGGVLTVVRVLEFDRWDIAAGFEQAAVVEPVDVLECGDLDLLDGAPRATWLDQLGLEQADQRLGQRVDAPISVNWLVRRRCWSVAAV
jgi:hypothetical protein